MNQKNTCPRCGNFRESDSLCADCQQRQNQADTEPGVQIVRLLAIQLGILVLMSLLGTMLLKDPSLHPEMGPVCACTGPGIIFSLVLESFIVQLQGYAILTAWIPLIACEMAVLLLFYKQPKKRTLILIGWLTFFWSLSGVGILFLLDNMGV